MVRRRRTVDEILDELQPEGDCLVWPHARTDKGYGIVHMVGRTIRVHRLAYERAHGAIPAGLVVRHTCDNRACAKPVHLVLGTNAQNTQDMRDRDRMPIGRRHWRARLTEADVRAIRAAVGVTQSQLGQQYGVPRSQIGKILRREAWSHIA